MSTKTTIKRIALVAVAALGLGVVSSVAPATAVERTPSIISVTSDGALRAGVAGSITATFTLPAGYAIGDSIIVGARVTSAPATSFATSKAAEPIRAAISSSTPSATAFGWAKASTGSGSYGGGTTTAGSAIVLSQSPAGDNLPGVQSGSQNWTTATQYVSATGDSTATQSLTLNFTPDATGSYTIVFFVGTGAAAYNTSTLIAGLSTANIAANLTTTSATFTTGSTPTAATITAVQGTTITGATGGAMYKLTLTDAAGLPASLGTGESITLASTTSTVSFLGTGLKADNATAVTTAFVGSNFSAGVAYFNVRNSATGTATFTATGSALLSSAVTATGSITTVAGSAGAPTLAKLSTNTALSTTGETAATTVQINYAKGTAATSTSLVVTGTAANVEALTITDTSGKITGDVLAVYVVPVTIGTLGTATVSVAGIHLAGEAFTAALVSTTAAVKTNVVTGRTSANTTLAPVDGTRRVAVGSTNTVVVNVKDQFGSNVAGTAVTVSVAGRNPKVASTILTDGSGNASYALADTGTVGTTDTITFLSTASITATLSYGSTDVTTLTIAGPNTDDLQVLLAEKRDISTAVAGAAGAVYAVTVTAKDAAGLVMAGIPVTFTVAGTTAAILSTKVTVYTGAAGTAATSVYAWANGVYVVTATAGGKTATDSVHFAQQTADEARTITAAVADNIVTATVKDRFGNPVPAVTVWATKTGIGYFGSGAGVTSSTTNEAGQAQFFVNGATTDTSVKVALGSATSTDLYYGQSGSLLGYVTQGDGGTSTIVTAATVGTTTTAETGIGAAFAPAGINSATVTVVGVQNAAEANAQAATDAAAEATDAANAATDAANAAAEAADAATAAAQDAADAVAALSTQVSEMIDALKKQITALTNLVIKIQKKVKA